MQQKGAGTCRSCGIEQGIPFCSAEVHTGWAVGPVGEKVRALKLYADAVYRDWPAIVLRTIWVNQQ